jgi:hypothetical protein
MSRSCRFLFNDFLFQLFVHLSKISFHFLTLILLFYYALLSPILIYYHASLVCSAHLILPYSFFLPWSVSLFHYFTISQFQYFTISFFHYTYTSQLSQILIHYQISFVQLNPLFYNCLFYIRFLHSFSTIIFYLFILIFHFYLFYFRFKPSFFNFAS